MARKSLAHIAKHPGGTSKTELVGALRRAGWTLDRQAGAHEVWAKGPERISVPHSLKSTGTIRGIAKRALAAD